MYKDLFIRLALVRKPKITKALFFLHFIVNERTAIRQISNVFIFTEQRNLHTISRQPGVSTTLDQSPYTNTSCQLGWGVHEKPHVQTCHAS